MPTDTLTTNEAGEGLPDGPVELSPFLFLVISGTKPRAGGLALPLLGVDEVRIGRGAARRVRRSFEGSREVLRLDLESAVVSTEHARVLPSERGGALVEDLGSRNGTFVDEERITGKIALNDGAVIRLGDVAFIYRASLPLERGPSREGKSTALPVGLRTLRPDLAERASALLRVARSPLSLLLVGETGSGKELHARAVHDASQRGGPFVPINCAAIAPSLVESTLFGHRRGAFSGALRDEPGLVRAADGGTLFLDEIADLPLAAQAALLRVLQEKEVLPVGATRAVAVDVRVVAATHKPLESLVSSGHFRVDLLARLRGYHYELLPLRDRREDLGLIVADLAARFDPGQTLRLEPNAVATVLRYDYPLNVRELEHALVAALAVAEGGRVSAAQLPRVMGERAPVSSARAGTTAKFVGEPDRDELVALLAAHQGNVAAVARAVDRAPMQVRRWMKRHGITPDGFRPGDE